MSDPRFPYGNQPYGQSANGQTGAGNTPYGQSQYGHPVQQQGAVNYPYTHPQQGAFTQSPYGQMTNENTQVMNPYSQAPVGQQNGQSASSASPYGQSSSSRQIGQQSFGQQTFGQPQFGQQSFGQQTYGQQQFGQQFGQPPKKKGNKGLIIGLIIAAVLVVGGIIAIFASGAFGTAKGGFDDPTEAIITFFDGFNARDNDVVRSTFPSNLNEDASSDIENLLDDLNEADDSVEFDVDSIDFSDATKLTKSEASKYGKGIKEAYEYDIDVEFTQDYQGSRVTATEPCRFVTIKWKNKWFNIYVKLDQKNIEVIDWGDVDNDDYDDDDYSWDEDDNQDYQAGSIDLSELINAKVTINGNDYQFPIKYDDVKDDLPVDFEYGDHKGNEKISAGNSGSDYYQLEKDAYDEYLYSYISMANPTDQELVAKDAYIYVLSMDISSCDTSDVPQIVFPGGITWGSTKEEIIAAYGTPEYDSDYTTTYTTTDGGYSSIDFAFDDEGKLDSIYFYNGIQ